jgi:Animal haem peroxidase
VSGRLLSWVAGKVDRSIGWSRLPVPLGIPVLVGLRDELRAKNLFGTGRGLLDRPGSEDPNVDNHLTARMVNGTYNDLNDPLMGSAGSRFGRNVPPTHTYPEKNARLLDPNPRQVSLRLFARQQFQPATTLNLLAAAWIQFEVHDWFSHGTDESHPWEIPVDDDDPWHGARPMTIRRTSPDPSPDPQGPPTFATQDTYWWDASQIYGSTNEYAKALRTGYRGQLKIDHLGLVPRADDRYLDFRGPAGNFWVGLAILHSLFMREHNAICERLAAEYPQMSDQDLYDRARLVNAALMAKIHTIDWTPAIIAHPTTVVALRANWFGLLGERFRRWFGRITTSEVLQGIPGSPTAHHGVPYALTEEFVSVYRMHSLLPDEFVFRSIVDDSVTKEYKLPDLALRHVRDRLEELPMDEIFYSFGRSHPGAITLHNFPTTLQDFVRADGERIDLAAIDILRDRERGVPRYNEVRRLFRLKPASSFEDLTDNPAWAKQLREIYGDVERVDLMVGLHAERKPRGFGFSDTAFRVFILMASRRLESDRFFATDFRPEVYTQAGFDWVQANTMRTVLLRHFPSLEPALRGVKNPFAPWVSVSESNLDEPDPTKRSYVRYSEALEQPRPDEDEVIDKIIDVLHNNNEWAFKKYKHAIRDAHAKSHGILRGELTVYSDLDPYLRQGLFAKPQTYDVIARLSSTAGAIRSDQLRGVRGLGIKVLNVAGERTLPADRAKTQDFLLVTHREFPFADAHAYYVNGMPLAWLLARLPDCALGLISDLSERADPVLSAVGLSLPMTLELFIRPNIPILGETFYSSAPLRYGEYVAKIAVVPMSESVKKLQAQLVPPDLGEDAHTKMVADFFSTSTAEYELQAQLCTDPVTMPIEDATVAWSEVASPHRPVARLTFPPQDPYSPERRRFGDDVLSFNSWRSLDAHRPLGSINRLKLRAYTASSRFRHEMNNVPPMEPTNISELPK